MDPVQHILTDIQCAEPRRLADTMHSEVLAAIRDGRLATGIKLPASRQLASALGISRNTVISVYDRLASEGHISSEVGVGSFVTFEASPLESPGASQHLSDKIVSAWRDARPVDIRKDKIVFDLLPGLPDTSLFPEELWRRLHARALRQITVGQSSYQETQGRLSLRRAVAKHLSATRAVSCRPENIIVTAGTQQALDILARIFVTPGKTRVAIEEPGYVFARKVFAMAGAEVVPVPVDEEGMIVDALPDEIDIIFVAPSHQFPTGYVMSPARRRALLEAAHQRCAIILEDDYQSEFPVPGKPAEALQSLDRAASVFYIGTFSKCIFPELRLGFVVAPNWALSSLLAAKQLACHETPVFDQDTLAAFISEGHLGRYVRRMRSHYETKRAAMIKALKAHCLPWIDEIHPDGGVNLRVRLKDGLRSADVSAAAERMGIRAMSMDVFFAGMPTENGLILGLGRIAQSDIDAAIIGLATACRTVSRAQPHL